MGPGPTLPTRPLAAPDISPRKEAATPQRFAKRSNAGMLVGPAMPTFTGFVDTAGAQLLEPGKMRSGENENWLTI